jgi:tetratricopeptide (TPR) repeat protein
MKSRIRPVLLAVLLIPGGLFAAETGSSSPTPMASQRDPVLERVSAATAQKDWAGAQGILKEAVEKNPGNADYHNLYAYTIRKGANPDMNLVFKHYNQALTLDPKHRGAHEYIGEAYLMVGNVAKAKEHLGALDKLCFFPCSEHTDLKGAIAEYETKRVAR